MSITLTQKIMYALVARFGALGSFLFFLFFFDASGGGPVIPPIPGGRPPALKPSNAVLLANGPLDDPGGGNLY